MIAVQLIGGLGNQMFQYALGRRLADANRTRLELDLSWFDNIENSTTKRRYELNCYSVKAKLIDMTKDKRISPVGVQASGRLSGRLFKKASLATHNEPSPSFHPEILKLPDNVYLKGYWQNEKYFMDIRHKLLKEFSPKNQSSYTKGISEQIRKQASISIHVRRGDYANNPLTNKFHGLTPIEYYTTALQHLESKAGHLRCYVFSDDIKWCKANLPFAKEATFVSGNAARRAYEDLYLMSLCQHNIIANSSFSWWGAWLNENPDKIIVAPKTWFQDKSANISVQIVPKGWYRL